MASNAALASSSVHVLRRGAWLLLALVGGAGCAAGGSQDSSDLASQQGRSAERTAGRESALSQVAADPGKLRWSQLQPLQGSPTGAPLFVSNNPEHVGGFGVLAGVPYPSLSLAKPERHAGAPLAQWTGGAVDASCPNGGIKNFGVYLAHILPPSLGADRRLTLAVVAGVDATVHVRGSMGTTDWSVNGSPRTTRTDWLGAEVAKSFFFANPGVRTLHAKAGQLLVIESIPVVSLVEGRFHLESDACLHPFTIAHSANLGSVLPGHYAPGDVKWPGWYQGQGYGRAAGVYEADGWTGTQTLTIAQVPSVQGIGVLSAKESLRALARHGDSAQVLFGNYGVLYDQTVTLENLTGACVNVALDFVSYVDRNNRPDRTPTVEFFQSTPKVETPTMFWNGPLMTEAGGQGKMHHPVLRYAPTSSELANPTRAVGSMRQTIASIRMQPGHRESVRVRLPVTGYIVAPAAITAEAKVCEGGAVGCGGVTAEGVCNGDILTWCDSGQLGSLNCAATGKTCGWDQALALHNCLDASTPAPTPAPNGDSGCGSIPNEGVCNGAVLSYCGEGEVEIVDCAAHGNACGWNPAEQYYDCVASPGEPAGGTADCGGITAEGVCDGNLLSWCEQGQVRSFDCGVQGEGCGWNEAKSYNDCVPPSSGCGQITFEGACDGTTLSWCEGGELMHMDCSSQGRSCGWSEQNGYHDCL